MRAMAALVAPAAATRSCRPAPAALARRVPLRRSPVPGRSGAVVVRAEEGNRPMYTNGVLLAGAMLGMQGPADFALSNCALTAIMAGAAGVAGLDLNLKNVKVTALTVAGLAAAAVAAPLLAQAALTQAVPAAVDAAALAKTLGKMLLLPLLAGAAINTALPGVTWKLRKVIPFAAMPLAFVVCSTVAARGAAAAKSAGPIMIAALFAVQAGAALLALAATRLLGAPKPESAMPTGLLAGAVLSAIHFGADARIGVACVCAAVLSTAVAWAGGASAASDDAGTASADAGAGADLSDSSAFIVRLCKEQGLPVPPAKAAQAPACSGQGLPAETYISRYMREAAAAPAVPANVASARAWIAAWRAKRT